MHIDLMLHRVTRAMLLNSRLISALSLLLKLQFGNLQPKIEINEYSSSKITRVLAATLPANSFLSLTRT